VAAINPDLHSGERAALALALDLKADLILIDDAEGRREAQLPGMRITGTLGVLRLAAERGLINVPEVVRRLRQSGFYFEEKLIQAAFGPWL
jgi:predicted nucleic acid-binding protein